MALKMFSNFSTLAPRFFSQEDTPYPSKHLGKGWKDVKEYPLAYPLGVGCIHNYLAFLLFQDSTETTVKLKFKKSWDMVVGSPYSAATSFQVNPRKSIPPKQQTTQHPNNFLKLNQGFVKPSSWSFYLSLLLWFFALVIFHHKNVSPKVSGTQKNGGTCRNP